MIRPEKPFDNPILAEKNVSISVKIFFFFFWRSSVFGLKNGLNFRFWLKNVVSLFQKSPPFFQILATRLQKTSGSLVHTRRQQKIIYISDSSNVEAYPADRNYLKISTILPDLTQDIEDAVKKVLENLGVCNQNDLEQVTEEDLIEARLLSKVQVRKLLKSWKKSDGDSAGLF